MALIPVVVVLIVAGLLWRARRTRRLTMEESVDRYRRTLSAVHDASRRSRASDGSEVAASREAAGRSGSNPARLDPPRFDPARFEATRFDPARNRRSFADAVASRRGIVLGALVALTIVAVVIVIVASGGNGSPRASSTTTTAVKRSTTTQATTTTRAAPTTTVPLIRPTGTDGATFTISKASYTIVVTTTTGQCWVDMRDPAGAALFSGTLAAGASQSVTASAVTMRLGNPAAVTLQIDGTPVPFTVANGSPTTLHFVGTPA